MLELTFFPFRDPPDINGLKPTEIETIWFPNFVFENTNQKLNSLVDDKASLSVLKVGEGKLNGNQNTENKLIFNGKENPVQYERFYSLLFQCEFSLHWYPFDTQDCYLDIEPSKDLKKLIKFVNDKFKYEGPHDLTEYNVKKITMFMMVDGKLRVEVHVQRRLMSLILTAFLPTIILNIMGHMSNYFKEFFFEGIMSLNVTVMLALTTIFLRYFNIKFLSTSKKSFLSVSAQIFPLLLI